MSVTQFDERLNSTGASLMRRISGSSEIYIYLLNNHIFPSDICTRGKIQLRFQIYYLKRLKTMSSGEIFSFCHFKFEGYTRQNQQGDSLITKLRTFLRMEICNQNTLLQ